MLELYVVIGVLIGAILLLVYANYRPKVKGYKFQSPIKKVQSKKPRKVAKKKKKSVWIKII